MEQLIHLVKTDQRVRVAAIVAPVTLLVLWQVPHRIWSMLALKAVYHFTPYMVAIVIAAAAGWITYSFKGFLQVAAALCGMLFLLQFVPWLVGVQQP